MSELIAEGLILVKSWSGHLDAPVPELRMIEKLCCGIEELEKEFNELEIERNHCCSGEAELAGENHDLNRLIGAWRRISERARNEIEAQQITIDKLNARCDRDDKLIFQMKEQASKDKATINNLRQKLESKKS